ncbi:MAG: hypothetical protein ED557_12915 [Balneola sp.]|nr:MAG: hypothetical protein ED557_12915 [Balneola sp.]
MSKSKDPIAQKKKELKANLVRIQNDLDQSLTNVRDEVAESFTPKEIVKKYPLPVIGVSLVIGFLLGSGGGSRKSGKSSKEGIAQSVGNSIKKKLTQKAVDAALDYVDEKFLNRKED